MDALQRRRTACLSIPGFHASKALFARLSWHPILRCFSCIPVIRRCSISIFTSSENVPVPPIVVVLGEDEKEPADDGQRNKNFVSIFVVWRILFLVHLFRIVSIANGFIQDHW